MGKQRLTAPERRADVVVTRKWTDGEDEGLVSVRVRGRSFCAAGQRNTAQARFPARPLEPAPGARCARWPRAQPRTRVAQVPRGHGDRDIQDSSSDSATACSLDTEGSPCGPHCLLLTLLGAAGEAQGCEQGALERMRQKSREDLSLLGISQSQEPPCCIIIQTSCYVRKIKLPLPLTPQLHQCGRISSTFSQMQSLSDVKKSGTWKGGAEHGGNGRREEMGQVNGNPVTLPRAAETSGLTVHSLLHAGTDTRGD